MIPSIEDRSSCLCLVLAAGQSQRFGHKDKRFARLENGQSVLAQTLHNIQQAQLDFRIAVKSNDVNSPLLAPWKDKCIIIQHAEKGMGHSLASALSFVSALPENYTQFIICLADMPFLQVSTLQALEKAIRNTSANAVLPILPEMKQALPNAGNPVAIKGQFIKLFQTLCGDKGGRSILKRYPLELEFITVDDLGIYKDIDTVKQLKHQLLP